MQSKVNNGRDAISAEKVIINENWLTLHAIIIYNTIQWSGKQYLVLT